MLLRSLGDIDKKHRQHGISASVNGGAGGVFYLYLQERAGIHPYGFFQEQELCDGYPAGGPDIWNTEFIFIPVPLHGPGSIYGHAG